MTPQNIITTALVHAPRCERARTCSLEHRIIQEWLQLGFCIELLCKLLQPDENWWRLLLRVGKLGAAQVREKKKIICARLCTESEKRGKVMKRRKGSPKG